MPAGKVFQNPVSILKTIAVAAVFIICFLLYLPAASGPYQLDDYPNLVDNQHLILQQWDLESVSSAAMSSPSSFLGRPLAMLTFAMNYTWAGDKNPYPVKITNILLHLLTGAGILILLNLLLAYWLPEDDNSVFWTALLATMLWLVHPLQISTVLYAVQRMTILSAFFTVSGLIAYMICRQRTINANSYFTALFLAVAGFTLLGVMAKENAILLPVFALIIEIAIFRFAFHTQTSGTHKLLVKAMLFIPLFAVSAYLVFAYFNARGEVIWPYNFTIDQRLLSQPRMMMYYLGWIVLINPEPMSLHHTDISLSTGLLAPPTTLASIILLVSLMLAAACSLRSNRYSFLGFGLLWFLAGHLLESSTLPLILIFEHRNYLPMMGILLIPAYVLVHLLRPAPGTFDKRAYLCAVVVLLAALPAYERITVWSDEKAMIADMLDRKPGVAWSWSDAASYLSRAGNPGPAIDAMRRAAELDPSEPAFIIGEAYIRCQHQPGQLFPEDFSARLIAAFSNRPLSPTSINSFNNMVNVCLRTQANDATLLLLYKAAASHSVSMLAHNGRLALEAMDRRIETLADDLNSL